MQPNPDPLPPLAAGDAKEKPYFTLAQEHRQHIELILEWFVTPSLANPLE